MARKRKLRGRITSASTQEGIDFIGTEEDAVKKVLEFIDAQAAETDYSSFVIRATTGEAIGRDPGPKQPARKPRGKSPGATPPASRADDPAAGFVLALLLPDLGLL